ncbi:MAG: isopenicillin N synthase family oxygenase, partial [Candidatus Eremiobacteraeota bacterium]|nr:isopenicillin N synthase family oxygenase [Candidatus Eremiobacteraeota bacterium]
REAGAAARGIGFFSIVNHGIAPSLIDATFAEARAFFALPAHEKERISVTRSKDYRGFVRIGEETLDPTKAPDVKECFNAGPDLAADHPDVLAGKPFSAVNQWPDAPSFKETLIAYQLANLELVVLLHRAFALDLAIDEEYFTPRFTRAVGILRLLYYPPHPGTFDGSQYGAGEHTDYGNLTLLAQDDVGGLEVRSRDGSWIDVPPMAGAFVCNIGDCLMRWSNDIYVSTPHRVVNRAGRERLAIAYFGDPNADALVSCLPSCLGPGEEPKYAPISYGDYLRSRYDATYTVPPVS